MKNYLVLLLALLTSQSTFGNKLLPFTTDGCSMFPDKISGLDWCSCCLMHDFAYWRGGTSSERLLADETLRRCVFDVTKDKLLADTMYQGVRIGGAPYSLAPYRWAYGWQEHRFYQALTINETKIAEQLQAVYLTQHPLLQCPQ